MSVRKLLFPVGAGLTLGGVLLYAALDYHSFNDTQDWLFAVLSNTFLPALLIGTPLAIVGSAIDRPLTRKQAKTEACFVGRFLACRYFCSSELGMFTGG